MRPFKRRKVKRESQKNQISTFGVSSHLNFALLDFATKVDKKNKYKVIDVGLRFFDNINKISSNSSSICAVNSNPECWLKEVWWNKTGSNYKKNRFGIRL